jgi:hypothetical protein
MRRILLVAASAALVSLGAAAHAAPGHGNGHASSHASMGGRISAGMHGPNQHASDRAFEVRRSLDAGVNPGRAFGRGRGEAGMKGPNDHASDRAFEVHRMLDAGVNPGHAYGRDKTSVRGRADVGDRRSVRAKANTRMRGSADVLGSNTHASARGVERGKLSSTHAARTKARAKVRTRPN